MQLLLGENHHASEGGKRVTLACVVVSSGEVVFPQ